MQRAYGWKPEPFDSRDFLFKHILFKEPVGLPKFIDLRKWDSPVRNQTTLGCCTGFGSTAIVENLQIKDGLTLEVLSPLFVYYNERVLENSVEDDAGAMIRDALKVLSQTGVCSEDMWPYNVSKFKEKPSDEAYKDAADRKVTKYFRIQSLIEMKICLASGFPFTTGIAVYSDFESERAMKTGVINMPTAVEQMVGGHCIAVVGYDDDTQRFICKNSWGTDWGQQGYFTIPYNYLGNPKLCSDSWTIRKGTEM